jgi:ferric-dicitrate binding protein FerR (iron transport regulator)
MNENEKAKALSKSLDAAPGGDAGLEGADEEIRALSALGRSLGDIKFEPNSVHRAAVERLLLKHRAEIKKAVTGPEEARMAPSQEASQSTRTSRPRWLVPLALAGSLAILFVCVVVVVGGGLAWRTFRGTDPAALTPSIVAEKEGVDPTPVPVAESPEEPEFRVFVPSVFSPLPPQHARLMGVRGVVHVQTDDGAWAAAGRDEILRAGQRVRTAALSSAQIAFYDGSVAYLDAETEVSLDRLGKDPDGVSRIVELTQWVGETDHDVAPAQGDNARYEVHTPAGSGAAKGTFFHVSVTPALVVRFSVDKGEVEVTHVNVMVVVLAGQLTTIKVGKPPTEPVFRVSGEGEVSETGETWVIAGRVFATDDGTVIIGNPQPGDWVRVDAHLAGGERVADRIVLLRRSPTNRFTITGEVEATGAVTWTVAGQDIVVDAETDVGAGIVVGDLVHVEGAISDGTLLAESIYLIAEPGFSFAFVGVVEGISKTYWTVSGISVSVTNSTEIEAGIVVSDLVKVEGRILSDGTWLATEIKLVDDTLGLGCLQVAALVFRVDADVIVLHDGAVLPLAPETLIEGELQANSIILFYLCFDAKGNAIVVSVVVIGQVDPVIVIVPPAQPPPEKKVTICHKPGTPAEKTMTVSESALKGHLGHGDHLGPCGGGDDD